MKQKDAIKVSIAVACLAAAGLIAYLSMREPSAPVAAPPTTPDAVTGATPAPGTPHQENISLPNQKAAEQQKSPIRVAPGGG